MNRDREEAFLGLKMMGADDLFAFRCTACGACCYGREDILLSPYDLKRMAECLGLEMAETLQKYARWYVGHYSALPVVVMKMRGEEARCPFLEERKCAIQEAKPTVCALFPLGRLGAENGRNIRYFMQKVDCGAKDREWTVREWLEESAHQDSEEWFATWQDAILPLVRRMQSLRPRLGERSLQVTESGLLVLLYVNYTREGDFLTEFRANVVRAGRLLDMVADDLKKRGTKAETDDGKTAGQMTGTEGGK